MPAFDTEKAAYEFVAPLLKLMPRPNAWKVRVHENNGWHVSLQFPVRKPLISLFPEPNDRGGVLRWWCLIGSESGAPIHWSPQDRRYDFRDPIRCLKYTLDFIKKVVDSDVHKLRTCQKCLEV